MQLKALMKISLKPSQPKNKTGAGGVPAPVRLAQVLKKLK